MLIDEEIDRIALLAEQHNYLTCLQAYFYIGFYCTPPLYETWKKYGLEWEVRKANYPQETIYSTSGIVLRPPQVKIDELNLYIHEHSKAPPALSVEQIRQITASYSFQLPVEFYKLYQRANGMFPIGVSDKDWQSFDNYFVLNFPPKEETFFSLHDAMHFYEIIRYIDSYMLPIMYFETGEFFAVKGSEIQQDISPVYSLSDDSSPVIVWSSIAEMLSNYQGEH